MSLYYLLLPNLKVSDCNWESSHLTRSLPLTAIAGFVNHLVNFELRDYAADAKATLDGFAVCIHDGQIYEGISKNPLALCKGNGGSQAQADLLNPPITPEIKGMLSMSLLMTLKLRDRTALDEWLKSDAIEFLLTSRLAGGDIIRVGKPKLYLESKDLVKAVRRLPPGWFVRNRADLIAAAADPFAALLDAVAWFPVDDEQQKASDQGRVRRQRIHQGHWLYATCVGYQLLESPQPRRNRSHALNPDDPVNHAYAEPAHSLAELVWARRLLDQAREQSIKKCLTDRDLLWRWHTDAATRTVYLSTQELKS